MNETLGYARVSTADQNPDLQVDELTAAGCHRIFVEHATGVRAERPQLSQALDHLRSGDTPRRWWAMIGHDDEKNRWRRQHLRRRRHRHRRQGPDRDDFSR